ncbi:MAG: DUF4435 domain-containing protein [Deltaproteobacteria bacterium]|nr:DUF4435 domain-containing protein [Deltaproteobacteria bacterium]
MRKVLKYTGEENLIRIKMQSNTKFILVEGEDDLPIYENIFHSHAHDSKVEFDFEVTFGGGKSNINDFIKSYKKNNFSVVLDLDFDHSEKISDERVCYLDRYSIENYFYSRVVIGYLLSFVIKSNIKETLKWLDITDWIKHVNDECLNCLKSIYYYQKKFDGDKSKWSCCFVLKDNGSWKIDRSKINSIITMITRDAGVTIDEIDDYFKFTFPEFECLTNVFPGKILFVSFYRFLKHFLENGYPGLFRANYTNEISFKNSAASFLRFNPDLRKAIGPVFKFLADGNTQLTHLNERGHR